MSERLGIHVLEHSTGACGPQPTCALHRPMAKRMSTWPAVVEPTRRGPVLMRSCQHGQFHPDPDDAAYHGHMYGWQPADLAAHGCECGCCETERAEVLALWRAWCDYAHACI